MISALFVILNKVVDLKLLLELKYLLLEENTIFNFLSIKDNSSKLVFVDPLHLILNKRFLILFMGGGSTMGKQGIVAIQPDLNTVHNFSLEIYSVWLLIWSRELQNISRMGRVGGQLSRIHSWQKENQWQRSLLYM